MHIFKDLSVSFLSVPQRGRAHTSSARGVRLSRRRGNYLPESLCGSFEQSRAVLLWPRLMFNLCTLIIYLIIRLAFEWSLFLSQIKFILQRPRWEQFSSLQTRNLQRLGSPLDSVQWPLRSFKALKCWGGWAAFPGDWSGHSLWPCYMNLSSGVPPHTHACGAKSQAHSLLSSDSHPTPDLSR